MILASSSPRRVELLNKANLHFNIIPSSIDESLVEIQDPQEYAMELALKKACSVAKTFQDPLIIGSDTVVSIRNSILGKPTSYDDAFNMLKTLSGKTHTVYTAVALINSEQFPPIDYSFCDVTKVIFYSLSDAEIHAYLETGEYVDKAGGYGIQGYGTTLVKSIVGNYDTVVGFPIARFLREAKINGFKIEYQPKIQ